MSSGGFRTSAIRADLSNKAEFAEIHPFVIWIFVSMSFLFIVITTIFWGELLFRLYNLSLIGFYLVLLGYIFSLSFPLIACIIGYQWAKATEYNRTLDSVQLTGAIAGQLAINSSNVTRGFFEAIETGRQIEREIDMRATEQKDGIDYNIGVPLINE